MTTQNASSEKRANPRVSPRLLRSLPLFRDAEPQITKALAEAATRRTYRAGQVILEEGSHGREMYAVLQGVVEVVKGRGPTEVVLARRGAGEFFGEMGLFEASPRFATVRALKPTVLLEFSERELQSTLLEQPLILLQAIRVLINRLRQSDLHMIADLQEKNQELARAYRELQEAQAALLEKERMERELELARDLQQSILPRTFPSIPGVAFAARSQPARQVGGDFYDVIGLDRHRVGLVIADVSDKGLPAALYMGLAHSVLHTEIRRGSSPRQALLNANRLLLEMSQADMFVTAFCGILDPADGTLRYARAGHDLPFLVRSITAECMDLAAQGTALGILDHIQLEEAQVELHPNDLLVLYTDGITDATSPQGEFYGAERLRTAVCRAASAGAQELCDSVFEQVAAFQQESVQYDDMAVLAVKWAGA